MLPRPLAPHEHHAIELTTGGDGLHGGEEYGGAIRGRALCVGGNGGEGGGGGEGGLGEEEPRVWVVMTMEGEVEAVVVAAEVVVVVVENPP